MTTSDTAPAVGGYEDLYQQLRLQYSTQIERDGRSVTHNAVQEVFFAAITHFLAWAVISGIGYGIAGVLAASTAGGGSSNSFSNKSSSDFAGAGVILLLAFLFSMGLGIYLFIRFLRYQVRIGLNEWSYVVDGRAQIAPRMFEAIETGIRRRQTPKTTIAREHYALWEGTHEYVKLSRGNHHAWVTAFAFGQDLFVGWSLWWFLTPMGVLREMNAPFLSTGDLFLRALDYDSVKAMRDVVHNVTREAVDSVTDDMQIPAAFNPGPGSSGTFGDRQVPPEPGIPPPAREACQVCSELVDPAELAPLGAHQRACRQCVAAAQL